MPTISARRNVADFGQPSAGPVQASTSSKVMPSSPIRRIAFSIEYVPMRLAMKFGVSLATTTPLPSVRSQKLGERFDHFGARCGAGNDFDQLQVARRIKEMRAGPVLLQFVGQALGDAVPTGQAGGIGGDDRAGLATCGDAREQRALDLQIFGDDFDDPVGFGAELQIVFEISGDDAVLAGRWREKRGGPRFHGSGQARANDAVADFRAGHGEAALFFVGIGLGGSDIEQGAPDSGVGHVRGDARAHGARAEDDDFFDGSFHRAAFGGMVMPFFFRQAPRPEFVGTFDASAELEPMFNRNEFRAPVQVTEATIAGQRETPNRRVTVTLVG